MKCPPIHLRPLPYEHSLDQRLHNVIDLVVIHSTELPDLEMAREFGEKIHYPQSSTGHSGHFYIDRDGRTEQWVDPARIAHHVRGFNHRSIGIELVNLGRYPNWLSVHHQRMLERYPVAQIGSLVGLIGHLCTTFASLKWIARHADLDIGQVPADDDPETMVRRKLDPGPLFPWERVLSLASLEQLQPEH